MSYSSSRLASLRHALSVREADAFYLRDQSSLRWLTAFDGVFDDEDAHAMIVTADQAVIHTDSRYSEAFEHAAVDSEIGIDATRQTHTQFAYRMLEPLRDGTQGTESSLTLAIETTLTLAEYRKLEHVFADWDIRFLETDDVVSSLRRVKDADEIARMKSAQALTDAAFAHIVGYMQPGMTEREVQLELEDYLVRSGAEGLAFSSIVATGPNGASPHSIPGATVLEQGQCVVLDFGARTQGYCSDMTRMVFLGEPDPRVRRAYETIRRANETVAVLLKPGVTGAEAHQCAEDILAEGGFANAMGHSLGHGVGIDIHEEPVLALRNNEPLVVGNVVTVEPGIYVAGEFGMRLEDYGVITHDGFEVFTQSSHEMVII
ncbi:MAG: Xaa-Pro peptidase family protein [Raoultibacter sp.]